MRTFLTATILLLSGNIWAQQSTDTLTTAPPKENKFTIDVNMLTRGEIRNGGLNNTQDEQTAAFVIERTLLGMQYERAGLTTRVTAQHSGTWGSNESSSFNLYEAWMQLKSKNGLFAKAGRQDLSYDDQRIFGADHWAMTAASHDALVLGFEKKGHKIHLMGAYNQNVKNMNGGNYFTGGIQPYKSMEALWYHYDVPKVPLGISLLGMNIGMQSNLDYSDTCTYNQQLIGTYLRYHPKKLSAELAFYYQMGKEENGLRLGAWMASAKLQYMPNEKLTVYGGYDYLSGDKNFNVPPKGMIGMMRHDKVRGFNSIFGSHHKFYGAMDFFYLTTYYASFTPGLQNYFVGCKWKPMPKLSADLAYHYLAVAADIEDTKKGLGHEIEASVRYQLMKDVRLSAGYSFMRGTDTMVALKRSSEDRLLRWGWVMISVSPKVFTTMW